MAISPGNRAKFEKLGLDFVRSDIVMGFYIEDNQERAEAREWMHEQEKYLARRDALRFWSMLLLTFIAAGAACVAAWPVMKDWLH
jgi:hypothetical protein